VAIEHTTNRDEADRLVERLSAVVPKDKIVRSTVSPVLGTYGGPGAVALTVLEAESK
jgi:fatty acid-binding protein DegV